NAGVIGMPANDGTPRTWYSVLAPVRGAVRIEHLALDYDHVAAAAAMRQAGLPGEYRDALASGIWPSCDVLPPRETDEQGLRLAPGSLQWPLSPRPRDGEPQAAPPPSWPPARRTDAAGLGPDGRAKRPR